MYVLERKMYHFHKSNKFDDRWQVGETIDNSTDDFESYLWSCGTNYSPTVKFDDDTYRPLSFTIKQYLSDDNLSIEDARRLLDDARVCIYELSFNQRELALEQVRQQYYPDKVSRRQAIWLCDEPQIEYWRNIFSQEHQLLRVSVTGNMFISSNDFIPSFACSYAECLEKAHDYWNPNLEDCEPESLEYLVNGKIKILDKMPPKQS